ncbi:MAG: DNA/RNA helicase domain-containing protein [Vicinamibacterales bacterium]
MTKQFETKHQSAWYHSSKEQFLTTPEAQIADQLAGRAADESLEIESAQAEEWRRSVALLQKNLGERIPILQKALTSNGCESVRDVILEFDFRRRGLRVDCLLLADGVLFVIEFKRSKIGRADRDQVMNYAVNLIEFHEVTQEWCANDGAIVIPILARTLGDAGNDSVWPGLAGHSWPSLANKPLECDGETLGQTLSMAIQNRRSQTSISRTQWLNSHFRPSSSILDAALSLYGNHDVAAIQGHAAPKQSIEASTAEIRKHIDLALRGGAYHVIFLSGAPGAGKTLVGLDLVMRGNYFGGSVFVSGNAPLVEVLNKALGDSYRAQGKNTKSWTPTGYRRSDARFVAGAANFKIVKAHNFLGKRGEAHRQDDGRVLVFDEAQRTYEKGRAVLGEKLKDHEADLILSAQRSAFPTGGAVVVALVGHNQAINRGERGMVAWLEAAGRQHWTYSISDETLVLAELPGRQQWATHPSRKRLKNGHLEQSMRFYRNSAVEQWVGAVLDGDVLTAKNLSSTLDKQSSTILMTRSLDEARRWARLMAVGGHRTGLIASGQGRRLAAEGLFVDHKPDIATWMLAPSSDIRSSNALETVQNQYQIQGLELDYCIVCWDADLRRINGDWLAYKLSGSDWKKDSLVSVSKNSYRVLMTRGRRGMTIFVPEGDQSGEDPTRAPAFYDGVWEFLQACGARDLSLASAEF